VHVVDDWPEPVAGSGQVIVRVLGVGVCGSDLALISGRWHPPAVPWVPGHETLGEIVALGPGVPPGRLGQRVAIEPNFPCGSCPSCRRGLTSACVQRISLGFSAPGTLAERIAVPAGFAWPVPGSWSDQDAVCLEPLTVAHAAIRRSGLLPGLGSGHDDGVRCLVIGAGSQGLLLCVALVAAGVAPHVLEPHEGRRSLAAALGAVPAAADDEEFSVVFETSGTASALAEATSRSGPGAVVVLIGLASDPVPLDAETVVRRQLRVQGSLTYDHPADFAATVSQPQLRPGRVLRARYPLEEAAQAFLAARQAPGKTWIRL
jgi:alcohol dehydrogenase/L-iditol 2-dehydrogenase